MRDLCFPIFDFAVHLDPIKDLKADESPRHPGAHGERWPACDSRLQGGEQKQRQALSETDTGILKPALLLRAEECVITYKEEEAHASQMV